MLLARFQRTFFGALIEGELSYLSEGKFGVWPHVDEIETLIFSFSQRSQPLQQSLPEPQETTVSSCLSQYRRRDHSEDSLVSSWWNPLE
jgi:hypothetical protein